jgi:hypothetical protein
MVARAMAYGGTPNTADGPMLGARHGHGRAYRGFSVMATCSVCLTRTIMDRYSIYMFDAIMRRRIIIFTCPKWYIIALRVIHENINILTYNYF